MINKWSLTSNARLATCHSDIILVCNNVLQVRDCKILEGHRGQIQQDKAFQMGFSDLKWPDGKHNKMPSLAVDLAPYFAEEPHIRWDDWDSWYYFTGIVKGIAYALGIKIRQGIDWDGDFDFKDTPSIDAPHFELVL